ncbi:MAG: hypothetical protein FWG79_03105 [Bacteroidales bacterium]|nr:hypothetical protein [Bacteroidales bacterium]
MKKIISLISALILSFGVFAQNDTMFIHQGQTVLEYAIADVDSITPQLGAVATTDSLLIYKNGIVENRIRIDDVDSIIFYRAEQTQEPDDLVYAVTLAGSRFNNPSTNATAVAALGTRADIQTTGGLHSLPGGTTPRTIGNLSGLTSSQVYNSGREVVVQITAQEYNTLMAMVGGLEGTDPFDAGPGADSVNRHNPVVTLPSGVTVGWFRFLSPHHARAEQFEQNEVFEIGGQRFRVRNNLADLGFATGSDVNVNNDTNHQRMTGYLIMGTAEQFVAQNLHIVQPEDAPHMTLPAPLAPLPTRVAIVAAVNAIPNLSNAAVTAYQVNAVNVPATEGSTNITSNITLTVSFDYNSTITVLSDANTAVITAVRALFDEFENLPIVTPSGNDTYVPEGAIELPTNAEIITAIATAIADISGIKITTLEVNGNNVLNSTNRLATADDEIFVEINYIYPFGGTEADRDDIRDAVRSVFDEELRESVVVSADGTEAIPEPEPNEIVYAVTLPNVRFTGNNPSPSSAGFVGPGVSANGMTGNVLTYAPFNELHSGHRTNATVAGYDFPDGKEVVARITQAEYQRIINTYTTNNSSGLFHQAPGHASNTATTNIGGFTEMRYFRLGQLNELFKVATLGGGSVEYTGGRTLPGHTTAADANRQVGYLFYGPYSVFQTNNLVVDNWDSGGDDPDNPDPNDPDNPGTGEAPWPELPEDDPTASFTVTRSGVWFETAFAEWTTNGGTAFEVHSSTDGGAWVKVDQPLVRPINPEKTTFRVDVLGLRGGTSTNIRITHTGSGQEETVSNLVAEAFDRQGFAFMPGHDSATGGYNADGTLDPNVKVVYLTNYNIATVLATSTSADLLPNAGNASTGVNGRQRLVIRILENITVQPPIVSSRQLTLRNPNGLTVEGVGPNAGTTGQWGFRVWGTGSASPATNVVIRNLTMKNYVDGIEMNTGSSGVVRGVWIHNNTFLIGTGGDGGIGDGASDAGNGVSHVTWSYNIYRDVGRAGQVGGTSNAQSSHMTFHHNHVKDVNSRALRVRFGNIHLFNNLYEGMGTYSISASTQANLIAEGNTFRNTNRPFIISGQGSERSGGGSILSSDPPGTILTSWQDNPETYMQQAGRSVLVPNEIGAGVTNWNQSLDVGAVTAPGNVTGSHTFSWSTRASFRPSAPLDNMLSTIGVQSATDAEARVAAHAGVQK